MVFSTGICESTTCGSGKLDFGGYWEFPCFECARYYEEKFPEYGPCWPFEEDYLEAVKNSKEFKDVVTYKALQVNQ